MYNILLVGGGAREHALARAFQRSSQAITLFYCAPYQNPGIDVIAARCCVTDLQDHQKIIDFALVKKIGCVMIGPETPLAQGLVDAFHQHAVPCIGPAKTLAQIEWSKGFARDLMREYNINGLPQYRRFPALQLKNVKDYLDALSGNYVVKADGLCGGKGVKVSGEHLHSVVEAMQYCAQIAGPFVIEEKLYGPEFSLISFTDGETILHFPPVQDHKRAYENDLGPNTGGMGSYTMENHLLPFLSKQQVQMAQSMNESIIVALQKKCNQRYIGFLYGGFMLTRHGVKVIEFNSRLGDPEAINLLSILKTDFVELCRLAILKKLSDIKLSFENKATVVKYVVPNGYPDHPVSSSIVISNVCDSLYFGAIKKEHGQFVMTGSRAVAVLGKGDTLFEAEKQAENSASQIQGPVFYRKDIGTEKLMMCYQKMVDAFV